MYSFNLLHISCLKALSTYITALHKVDKKNQFYIVDYTDIFDEELNEEVYFAVTSNFKQMKIYIVLKRFKKSHISR